MLALILTSSRVDLVTVLLERLSFLARQSNANNSSPATAIEIKITTQPIPAAPNFVSIVKTRKVSLRTGWILNLIKTINKHTTQ
jgi:hypothetical protein